MPPSVPSTIWLIPLPKQLHLRSPGATALPNPVLFSLSGSRHLVPIHSPSLENLPSSTCFCASVLCAYLMYSLEWGPGQQVAGTPEVCQDRFCLSQLPKALAVRFLMVWLLCWPLERVPHPGLGWVPTLSLRRVLAGHVALSEHLILPLHSTPHLQLSLQTLLLGT